ncbi:Trp biosynthesis-associated membrane protein [Microlunatus sp. Y2014]|uniref:Trp biosynthesis-associated membrane protein n=1 Tax=Microlunatus sp. Y2014 TaxID=3418488 RepID=UPI003DA770C9
MNRPAFAGTALGGVAGLLCAGQPWWQVGTDAGPVQISGADAAAGLPTAVAAVVAAGALLSLALRGRGRTVLGVVLAVAAVGMVVLGVVAPEPTAPMVAAAVQQVSLGAVGELTRSWGGWAYAASGLVGLAGAVALVVVRGKDRTGDRFDRTAKASAGAAVSADGELDPLLAWRALDAGDDPTDPNSDPDSPSDGEQDTMRGGRREARTPKHAEPGGRDGRDGHDEGPGT